MSRIKTRPHTRNMGGRGEQTGVRIDGDHGFLFIADKDILHVANHLADYLTKRRNETQNDKEQA